MQALGGSVSYRVTQNPAACQEVHLGTLTKPPEVPYEEVSAGQCHPEIRAADETELHVTAACQFTKGFTMTFPRSREKSGPKWAGIGEGTVGSFISHDLARLAVNSWDGVDITYSFLDPTSFGQRNKIKGQFWVDIYDIASEQRLIQIQGTFRGAEPGNFQGHAAWYGDRYYVMPVGGTLGSGEFSLRRLLICDVDAAERSQGNTVLRERK